jgi:hypothetical protein
VRQKLLVLENLRLFLNNFELHFLTVSLEFLNHLKKELYEIISERTGQVYDRVYKDGDRDYWMSAQDAKKYGMID